MGTYQYTEKLWRFPFRIKDYLYPCLFSSAPDIPPVPRLKETVNKDHFPPQHN